MEKELIVKNIDETFTLASKITSQLFVGAVVLLRGDLGAGKTTFVKGAAKELEIKELIQSPTFNILKCYFDAKIPKNIKTKLHPTDKGSFLFAKKRTNGA